MDVDYKKQAENRKKLLIVFGIVIATLLTGIGVGVAYYAPQIFNSDTTSTIQVGSASITITLAKGEIEKTITADGVIPGWSDTKNFKVTVSNNSGKTVTYKLNLVVVQNDYSNGNMAYKLAGSGDSGYATINEWQTLNKYTSKTTVFMSNATFTGDSQTHNYVLTIGFLETSTVQNEQNKVFVAYPSLSTGDTISVQVPVDKSTIWNTTAITSIENSLLTAIKTNTNIYQNPQTAPKTANATGDEGLIIMDPNTSTVATLSTTNSLDDTGGYSYFFRGAVENNYVEFANKCWRIVRIDGDNNIKLVLYNNNTSGAANPCSVTSTGAAYIGSAAISNGSYNRNTYVGFMYANSTNLGVADDTSKTDSERYAAEHAHNLDGNALKALKTWYNTYFYNAMDASSVRYQDYLADVVWCNDISTTGKGYGTNNTNYGYTNRTNPTYNCPTGLSRYTSEDYAIDTTKNIDGAVYKMGLLTADEVAFAGGTGSSNSSYYLYKNSSSSNWWELSPRSFSGYAHEWLVNPSGLLNHSNVYNWFALRAAISLKSTATISSGNGTSSTPYIISGV